MIPTLTVGGTRLHEAYRKLCRQRYGSAEMTAKEHRAAPRIFLVCRICGHEKVFHVKHRESLAKRLGKPPDAITVSDVLRNSALFRCKEGHRAMMVREEERKPTAVRYVASGTHRHIFHLDTCGWVGRIHKASMIEFDSREHAWQSGFDPCKWCRP